MTLFLILAVGAVYILSAIPILMQFDVIPGKALAGQLGLSMERGVAALLTVVLFIAALLVTALDGGRPAVRELFRRMLRWKVSIAWWIAAAAALPALTVLIAVLLGDTAAPPTIDVL